MTRRLLLALLLTLAAWLAPDRAARAQVGADNLFSPSTGDDPASAKELALPDGPDEVVFLRAMADKTKVVVGEQVIVSVYLYYRVAYEMSERNDAKYTDFLRYSLLADPGATTPVYTQVKGQRYGARLVDRVALIPLKAGKLATGSMTARFKGRQIGARVLKTSNDLTIEVEEPPLLGRPKNYVLGDVGQFTVSATVTPRSTSQGGSIGVVVKIEGVGNAPTSLTPPVIAGAKWLEPRRRDAISGKSGKIAGTRYFDYVLRFGNAGPTELGTLEVPYFDPVTRKYEVAKVELGKVEVLEAAVTQTEVDRAKDKGEAGADPLKNLPKHRAKLSAFTPKPKAELPLSLFALGLGLPPLFALLVLGAGRARSAIKARQGTASAALKQKLKDALRDAHKADKAGDTRALSTAIERSIHAAIEAKTSIKSRALRLDELTPRLVDAGLSGAVVEEAKSVLEECDTLRFAPDVDDQARAGLHTRAKALLKKLGA